jgi:vacuolar-type H+-ATPase subunit I/STV1
VESSRRIYGGAIRTLSFLFIALGLLILVSTLVNGGGPLSLGTVLGLAFVAVGVIRLWLTGTFRGRRPQ